MKLFLFFVLLSVLFNRLALAEGSLCELKTTQDILECALRNHPDLVISQAARDRDVLLADAARQRPNPELTNKTIGGSDAGTGVVETETSLFHTFELGGKRKSRIRQAQAEGEVTTAEFSKTREEVTLTTVLTLYRLSQIQSELGYVRESVRTFERIVEQYRSRSLLTPEQSVSNSVFEMAQEDYRLKETGLLEEEAQLKSSLEFATGLPYATMKRYLPPMKRVWPKIPVASREIAVNSDLQRATAEKKLAETGFFQAKSQSWPDLKIGPTVETRTHGGNNTLVGGSIALPLPLLNVNRGGKRFAEAEKTRADLNLRITEERLSLEREKQRARYEIAVQGITQTRLHTEITARHKGIDDLFERALVPSALVIESHRQMVEVSRTYHERELEALESLWRIYILDGRALSEKI